MAILICVCVFSLLLCRGASLEHCLLLNHIGLFCSRPCFLPIFPFCLPESVFYQLCCRSRPLKPPTSSKTNIEFQLIRSYQLASLLVCLFYLFIFGMYNWSSPSFEKFRRINDYTCIDRPENSPTWLLNHAEPCQLHSLHASLRISCYRSTALPEVGMSAWQSCLLSAFLSKNEEFMCLLKRWQLFENAFQSGDFLKTFLSTSSSVEHEAVSLRHAIFYFQHEIAHRKASFLVGGTELWISFLEV